MTTLSLGVNYLDRLVPRSAGKVTGGALFWTLIINKSCLFFPPFPFFKWWKSLFRHQFVSDSLRPHGRQHVRPPYLSPSPGVCPSLCPLNWWCHPTISSSVTLFCPQSFPASKSFPVSQFFASGGQRTGVSASASVLPMSPIQDWFPLGLTGLISLLSKGLSRIFSNTTVT